MKRIEHNDAMVFARALLQKAVGGRLPGASERETEKWLYDHIREIQQAVDATWAEHPIKLDEEMLCHYRNWKIQYRVNDYSMEFVLQVAEEEAPSRLVFRNIASGEVKWDHCVNFSFDTDTLHLCGEREFAVFPLLWKEIYKLASKMPHWLDG